MPAIHLICVGKAKRGSPELDLFDKYAKRCRFDLKISEISEAQGTNPAVLMAQEAANIQKRMPAAPYMICLDERGRDLASPEFASHLASAFENQLSPTFIIGGSHGLDPELRARSALNVRFGRVVWPHLLIRGMLAEQIYRAQTILDGHPYHRT